MPIVQCYQHPRTGQLYEMSDKEFYVQDLKREALNLAKAKYRFGRFTYLSEYLSGGYDSYGQLLDELDYHQEDILRSFMFDYSYDEFFDTWRAKKWYRNAGNISISKYINSIKYFRNHHSMTEHEGDSVEIVFDVFDWGYLRALWVSNKLDVVSSIFSSGESVIEFEASPRNNTLTLYTKATDLVAIARNLVLELNSYRLIEGEPVLLWSFNKTDIEEYYGQIKIR